MNHTANNAYQSRTDAFEEVAAIFAASGVEITDTMLELMSPLMSGVESFEQHRANLSAKLNRMTQ